ncbi:cupin domain-containing protein [Cellvibrio sp. NN19]|uniref:(R)-mandelonitrile lyase n=1 Tax=Cellvibrio chitinivorans TaxID=3102792 RepID=UPI002B408B41|nr:cupin domain-containing protein [Cellvibrio sp. NN19]
MILNKKGSATPFKGPAEWFTGNVMIDPIHLQAQKPSRITSALVSFEPGARTNWHTHPLGQLLIVTSGSGWTQCEGEARVEIKAGDSIWCPPGHKHWHGATSSEGMSHIAVQESLNGENVKWLEPVTDEQYGE